jgi:hypothetical protein
LHAILFLLVDSYYFNDFLKTFKDGDFMFNGEANEQKEARVNAAWWGGFLGGGAIGSVVGSAFCAGALLTGFGPLVAVGFFAHSQVTGAIVGAYVQARREEEHFNVQHNQ